MNIVIINYNSGNLASLTNTIKRTAEKYDIRCSIVISNRPEEILKAEEEARKEWKEERVREAEEEEEEEEI